MSGSEVIFFPFLSVFEIPSIDRVVVPLRKGQPESPWVFCKQAAAHLWVLPFCAIVPLGVSSEGLQPHSKDSSESVTCLSPKKCFFKNVPGGEVKWRTESLLVQTLLI